MRKLYLLILPFILITSCSEEVVNPVSNYTWPVVQCLINYEDSVHYLRLGKTFSGSDLEAMMNNPDSLYYKEAKVYFDIIENDHLIETIQLEVMDELHRDPGFFPETPFRLYKTDAVLTPGKINLRIELAEEDKYVMAGIDIMGEPRFDSPDPRRKKILYFYGDAVVLISWFGCDASAETIVRFWYQERTENGIDTCKLDWIRRDTGFILEPNAWFDYMLHSIKDDYKVLARNVLKVDFLLSAGNRQWCDYQARQDFAFDLLGEPYSNVNGAYGFVGSRANGGIYGYMPDKKFLDSLTTLPRLKKLKFVYK